MSMKVLVADDSPTIRRRASATLTDAGFEVTCVEDGRAAWRELDAGRIPDVVLCDVLMPEMDGYELCQMVKADERLRRVPVMLLRGTFEPWDQARAESVGADGFITKPFEPEALVSTLREVVEEAAADAPSEAARPAAPVATAPAPPAAPPPQADPLVDESETETEEVARHADTAPPTWNAILASVTARGEAEEADDASPLDLGDTLVDPPLRAEALASSDPLGTPEPPADPEPSALESADAWMSTPEAGEAPGPAAAWMAAPASSAPFDDPFNLGEEPPAAAPLSGAVMDLDDAVIERIARKVMERISAEKLADIAWEVVPEVAEALIRKRLLEIEARLARD